MKIFIEISEQFIYEASWKVSFSYECNIFFLVPIIMAYGK